MKKSRNLTDEEIRYMPEFWENYPQSYLRGWFKAGTYTCNVLGNAGNEKYVKTFRNNFDAYEYARKMALKLDRETTGSGLDIYYFYTQLKEEEW